MARSATRPMPRRSPRPIPDRFFEQYIAEQQLVAAAVGLAGARLRAVRLDLRRVLHPRLRLHPHGGDLARQHPALRLARRRLHRRGWPLADGARRPGDDARRPRQHRALSLRRQPDRAARGRDGRPEGIVYLRTTREKTPVLYGPDETFPIGGSRVLRQSDSDQVTVVGAGITLHEALKAYDQLKGEGVDDPRDRRLLGQADRRRRRCARPPRRPAAASSRSRITGARVAWATPCWKPSPEPTSSSPRRRCRRW